MIVQQSHHILGGNVALLPTVRDIAAVTISPAQVNAVCEPGDVSQSYSCSGAGQRPQDGNQDQVTAVHTHGTAVDGAFLKKMILLL